MGLRTAFHRADTQTFTGYAVCESDLNQRFVVELLIDGFPADVTQATEYHQALAGVGDGCYGFSFALVGDVLADNAVVEARLANYGDTGWRTDQSSAQRPRFFARASEG